MNDHELKRLRELLQNSRRAVFFGGAGVSTESGVKDYRSKDGIYNTVKEYGVSPEVILSHSFFLNKTKVFYDFYYKYFLKNAAEPNAAHRALAALEEKGHIAAVITQNIDGLHQRAGSRRVIELHGTVAETSCMKCGAPFPTEEIAALKGDVPRCPRCGGLVKPRVVLYDEALPQEAIDAALRSLEEADLLIIGGTSLTVYPAAGLIRYYGGRELVLINKQTTPADEDASLLLRDPIGAVFAAVMEGFV